MKREERRIVDSPHHDSFLVLTPVVFRSHVMCTKTDVQG